MEKLSDKTRIHAFFQRMLEKRTLLTVFINGREKPYSSAIIKVGGDSFIIDELKPDTGNKLLDKNSVIHIKAQLDGISIDCHARIDAFGEENDITFYQLAIPTEIEYRQRRQAVRIRLSAAYPLPVTFSAPNEENFEGVINDISTGGIRARFNKSLSKTLKNGQHLSCSFLLPPDNKQTLNSELIIRVIKHDKDQFGASLLGAEFIDMPTALERQLQRSIMSLQRASRQKDNI